MSAAPNVVCLLLATLVTHEVQAQRVDHERVAIARWVTNAPANGVIAQAPTREGGGPFIFEALGGSLGSLVGIGVVGLTSRCGVDDLACGITSVGAGGVLGVVGATVGTLVVARYQESPRSTVGAVLGALVGTGVGLGVHYVLNNNSDRNLGDAVVVPIFVLSQGVLAAVGSRVAGRR
jgi:hypothetical protein